MLKMIEDRVCLPERVWTDRLKRFSQVLYASHRIGDPLVVGQVKAYPARDLRYFRISISILLQDSTFLNGRIVEVSAY